jgi:hypothetical protein
MEVKSAASVSLTITRRMTVVHFSGRAEPSPAPAPKISVKNELSSRGAVCDCVFCAGLSDARFVVEGCGVADDAVSTGGRPQGGLPKK